MFKKRTLLFCLIFSIALHAFLFTYFSFYVKTSNTPFIFSWPAIFTKEDLLVINKPVNFNATISFARTSNMDKSYFLPSMEKPLFGVKKESISQGAQKLPESHPVGISNLKETDYLYIWEKPKSFTGWDKETIQYKAFVSPYGKVILSFPMKLPVNSNGNMSSQDYMRQAALFLKNKFLWTKIEAVLR